MRKHTIELIMKIVKQPNAFDILEKNLQGTTREQLIKNIIECGILPEMFAHDSSEEKLWAKYSDIVLSLALNFFNIPSLILAEKIQAKINTIQKAINQQFVIRTFAFACEAN